MQQRLYSVSQNYNTVTKTPHYNSDTTNHNTPQNKGCMGWAWLRGQGLPKTPSPGLAESLSVPTTLGSKCCIPSDPSRATATERDHLCFCSRGRQNLLVRASPLGVSLWNWTLLFSRPFLQYVKNDSNSQPVPSYTHRHFTLHISLKDITWVKKRKEKKKSLKKIVGVTNNFAAPRTCPGQCFLRAVLNSLHDGTGERGRGCLGPPRSPSRGGHPQPTPPRSPTGAPAAMVLGWCSPVGLLPGPYCWAHRTPHTWAWSLEDESPPQNCASALAGWEEGNPGAGPTGAGSSCQSSPWSPAPGVMQSPSFCWIWPQGLPGKSVLPMSALCDFQASSKPTSSLLCCCCCQVVPKHRLLSAPHHFAAQDTMTAFKLCITIYLCLSFKHTPFGTKDITFPNYKTHIQTIKLTSIHPLKVLKLLGKENNTIFNRIFPCVFSNLLVITSPPPMVIGKCHFSSLVSTDFKNKITCFSFN